MRPKFDGIPPPDNPWGEDMGKWINDRTEPGGLAELTCYNYSRESSFTALARRITEAYRRIFP